MPSPRITSLVWGNISIDSEQLPSAKDCKLFPNGCRRWDWNETGTRHQPGIQQADVEELAASGATDVVLSRGMESKLGVPDQTIRWLQDHNIKVHVADTREAVEIYNRLVQTGTQVAGCFHSTC